MLVADCIACQFGDHSGHVEWPSKPPPGVIGGHKCACTGECENDRGRAARRVGLPGRKLSDEEVTAMQEAHAETERIFEQVAADGRDMDGTQG